MPEKRNILSKHHTRGPETLGHTLSRLLKKFAGKHDQLETELLLQWSFMMGEEIALKIKPVKISFSKGKTNQGILYAKAINQSYAPLIVHQIPVMIEKVNTYFGYEIIAEIKMQTGQMKKNAKKTTS